MLGLELGEVLFVMVHLTKMNLGMLKQAMVITHNRVLKAEPYHSHLSAQAAELVALTKACKSVKDNGVTIYTDSQYAFFYITHIRSVLAQQGDGEL